MTSLRCRARAFSLLLGTAWLWVLAPPGALAQEVDEEEMEGTAGEVLGDLSTLGSGEAAGASAAAGEGPEAPEPTLGQEPELEVPYPFADLPSEDRSKLTQALDRLESAVDAKNPPKKALFKCWIHRLRNSPSSSDVKIVEWTRVCPGLTGGASAADCAASAVGEEVLGDHIDDANDVEIADESLHFLPRLSQYVVVLHEQGTGDAKDQQMLADLDQIAEEMRLARVIFGELMASQEGYGLTPQHKALYEWIEEKAGDPASVVSCVAEHGSDGSSAGPPAPSGEE